MTLSLLLNLNDLNFKTQLDTMIIELRGKSKNIWEYLSSYDGRYRQKIVLEEDRLETLGIIHHISILESNHAASLKMGGTARTYHSCAKGQT